MFLVDKLSKKFALATAQATFGILCLLACLLACASLLTPAWRHATADVRFTVSSGPILSGLKLDTGLFPFACNFALEQSESNKYPVEGTELCRGWAEVQSLYEKIASALLLVGLAGSFVAFFWNLLAKRLPLVKFLPFLALVPTLLLGSGLILFFVFSCRDTRLTEITLAKSRMSLNNTGCSIGHSYTLALLAFLLSLASVLVGALISAKAALRRQQRKPSKQNTLIKKNKKGGGTR